MAHLVEDIFRKIFTYYMNTELWLLSVLNNIGQMICQREIQSHSNYLDTKIYLSYWMIIEGSTTNLGSK